VTVDAQQYVGTVKISEKIDHDNIVTFSGKDVDQELPEKV